MLFLEAVLASLGCYDKMPEIRPKYAAEMYFSLFWRPGSLNSVHGLVQRLVGAALWCFYEALTLTLTADPSHEGTILVT